MSTAEKLLDSLVAVNIELHAWADANTQKLGVQAETLAGDLVIEHGDLLAALKGLSDSIEGSEQLATCRPGKCPECDAIDAAFKAARAVIARVEGGGEQ